MSELVDLLLVNGTVVTMDSDFSVVPQGAVAVRGREIVAVGATAALTARRESGRMAGLSALLRPT